jgi:hypothetical protein
MDGQEDFIVMILDAARRAWSEFQPSQVSTWLVGGGVSVLVVAIAALCEC